MSRKSTAAITTACVSVAACTAAYMMAGNNKTMSKSMKNRTKVLKKNTGKALRQVGDFIDNVSYMMR